MKLLGMVGFILASIIISVFAVGITPGKNGGSGSGSGSSTVYKNYPDAIVVSTFTGVNPPASGLLSFRTMTVRGDMYIQNTYTEPQ